MIYAIVILTVACVALLVAFVGARKEAARHASEAGRLTGEAADLRVEATRLAALLANADALARQRAESEEMMRHQFRNLANDIFDEKSAQFKAANREAMDLMLKPFHDNIAEFRRRVEHIYADENQQRGALRNELKNLHELNRLITAETTSLTRALRGNSKSQGDWGETILVRLLETSGLQAGRHFTVQENLKDAAGNNLRPDVVLNLPDERRIVIDSKVSLTAFVAHTETEDPAESKRWMDEHVASVRRHARQLGSREYQKLMDSPDFVVMFIPVEPAFIEALKADSTIWDDAYNQKVIVSSPTNLFALLKIVDDLWKRDDQSRNALEIAERGARLYDKFAGFVETFQKMGRGLQGITESYESARKQLFDGSGNLIGQTEKLRKLGINPSKTLPRTEQAED
jgi:DNA recombination protein RmuC